MSTQTTDAVFMNRLAASDLSDKQYYVVKADGSGEADLAGAGELALGSLQNDPEAGQVAGIQHGAIAKYVAGAATTQDALLASDANGKLIDAVGGDYTVGIGLEAAGADGDIIKVLNLKMKI